MTSVQVSKDCGNSPKNQFVQDVAIALETGELEIGMIDNDVSWYGAGDDPIEGLKNFEQFLAGHATPSALVIDHAISHGKVGAASGEVMLANGHRKRFCHVFEFTNIKANCVATIKSFS